MDLGRALGLLVAIVVFLLLVWLVIHLVGAI